MCSVDADCVSESLVDVTFCWVRVWIFEWQPFEFENWMSADEILDFFCFMVGCVVDEEDYTFDSVSFRVCDDVA